MVQKLHTAQILARGMAPGGYAQIGILYSVRVDLFMLSVGLGAHDESYEERDTLHYGR
jgi:hypothetical protein